MKTLSCTIISLLLINAIQSCYVRVTSQVCIYNDCRNGVEFFKIKYSEDGFSLLVKRNGGDLAEDEVYKMHHKYDTLHYRFEQMGDTIYLVENNGQAKAPCFSVIDNFELVGANFICLHCGSNPFNEYSKSVNWPRTTNDDFYRVRFENVASDGHLLSVSIVTLKKRNLRITDWSTFVNKDKYFIQKQYIIKGERWRSNKKVPTWSMFPDI